MQLGILVHLGRSVRPAMTGIARTRLANIGGIDVSHHVSFLAGLLSALQYIFRNRATHQRQADISASNRSGLAALGAKTSLYKFFPVVDDDDCSRAHFHWIGALDLPSISASARHL